jgi:hypothetical protein
MTKNLAAMDSSRLAAGIGPKTGSSESALSSLLPIACCLLPIAFFLTGLSGVANAQTPQINLPESALQGDTLPPDNVRQLTDRIKFCLNAVSNAKDATEAKRFAASLIEGGYNRYDSNGFHLAYAAELAKLSPPVLAKLEGTQAVLLAVELSMVPELPMQPCFDAMAVHSSAAVRYFGWKGHLSIRAKVIAAGKGPTDKMMDLLDKQFKVETSSVVLGVMLDMMNWPAPASAQIQKKSWDILQQAWPSLGSRVLERDQEMSRSCRTGLTTLESLWPSLAGKDQTKALQMLVDMMYYSAKAYGASGAEGLVADINGQLTRDSETLLAKLSGIQKKPVADALSAKDTNDRKISVPLAVLEGWMPDLKGRGLVAPKLPTPPAAPSTPE